jgi:hypothetical protein
MAAVYSAYAGDAMKWNVSVDAPAVTDAQLGLLKPAAHVTTPSKSPIS